ncbi:MAG TPA: hypothetical protein VFJ98_07850 [Mycobacteriales bacterium]|jgi:hypothetical protein|nr:hypothetical protein [Mycobacteriales bacterium]
MVLVLLRGGSRDGESTDLDEHVDRLYAASDAPGLIDVYEATESTAPVEGNDSEAVVFAFVGQEPLTEHEGTQLHMPHTRGYA